MLDLAKGFLSVSTTYQQEKFFVVGLLTRTFPDFNATHTPHDTNFTTVPPCIFFSTRGMS